MLLLWIIYVISVLFLLCYNARLFVGALWPSAGKGLTSWFSFVMSYYDVVTFPLVLWVRCGAWLYRFLIFSLFLTYIDFIFLQNIKIFQTVVSLNWTYKDEPSNVGIHAISLDSDTHMHTKIDLLLHDLVNDLIVLTSVSLGFIVRSVRWRTRGSGFDPRLRTYNLGLICFFKVSSLVVTSSLQCYGVLSDISV